MKEIELSIESIVAEIDSQIARLEQAKRFLNDMPEPKRGPGRPRLTAVPEVISIKPKRRTMSRAARKKIADAQRARWAKTKAAKRKPVIAKS